MKGSPNFHSIPRQPAMSHRLHFTIFVAFVAFYQLCCFQSVFGQTEKAAEIATDSGPKSLTSRKDSLDKYLSERLGFNQVQITHVNQNISHISPEKIQTLLRAIEHVRQYEPRLGRAPNQRFYIYNRNLASSNSDPRRYASRVYSSPQIANASGRHKVASQSMWLSPAKVNPYLYVFRNGEIGFPGYQKYRRPELTAWSYLVDERARVLGIDRNVRIASRSTINRQPQRGFGTNQTLTSRMAGASYPGQTATYYSRFYNRSRYYPFH